MMLTVYCSLLSGEINLAMGRRAIYQLKKYNVLPSMLAVDGNYYSYETVYADYYPARWVVTLEQRYQIQRIVVLFDFYPRKFLVLTLSPPSLWTPLCFNCAN